MRILLHSEHFAPSIGGVEIAVLRLADALARGDRGAGAPVEVLVVTETEQGEFPDHSLPFRVLRRPGTRRLWQSIKRAELLHLAGPVLLPLAIGLLLRKPVVIQHHGYQAICPNSLLLYRPASARAICPGHFVARRYLECLRCNAEAGGPASSLRQLLLAFPRAWLSRLATANVGVSDHVLRRLGLPRALRIYHGVPDPLSEQHRSAHPEFAPGQVSPRRIPPLEPAESPPIFAYVGRLVHEKGLPLLIQAAARLQTAGYDFRLRFIGDGPDASGLQRLAHELGVSDRIHFTGFLDGAALLSAVADVVAVMMPSIWEETAGLAAIEQMMRGRLVIAANVGGLGEMVADAGLTFRVGDLDGLVACMRQVLDDPAIVTRLGQRARERALRLFAEDRLVRDLVDLYHRLV